MKNTLLTTMLWLAALSGGYAQTTTSYTLPVQTCASGVENCYYEIANGSASGVFEAGGYWTQFDYRAYPGQNPGYQADYCNGTAAWTVAATPDLGPTAFLYSFTCQGTDLNGVTSVLTATIQAHSFVYSYTCGGRVRTTCHQTQWAIDEGVLTIVK